MRYIFEQIISKSSDKLALQVGNFYSGHTLL